ncbi:MAG: alpha/beta hydrolase [Chlamydiales bacterium]|nr:alpha/beta hydrolase [Chlamydiales bacterium]
MTITYQLGISLIVIIMALTIFQSVATIIDNCRYPPPGKLIDIGGYKLHIHSTGQGGPTVVLDAGLSGTSLGWSLVQMEVSKFTRVCSYDRAGYAWSNQSPSKRSSLHLAQELHALLHNAKIPGPYILVGHSFGGCNVLLFADLYPKETIGVILVDSVHEDMLQERPTSHFNFQWLLSAIGFKRLQGPSNAIVEMFTPLPEQIRHMYIAQMNKTSYTQTVSREMEALNESLCQLRERKVHLQDKPLVVITAGKFANSNEEKAWKGLQKKLLLKSYRSKQVIADKSDHMINHHQPEIIIEAIREILRN